MAGSLATTWRWTCAPRWSPRCLRPSPRAARRIRGRTPRRRPGAVVVFHPYSPAAADRARGAPTRAALAALGPSWVGHVHHLEVGDDDHYEVGLRRLWGGDDVVVVEHDVEPTPGGHHGAGPPSPSLVCLGVRAHVDACRSCLGGHRGRLARGPPPGAPPHRGPDCRAQRTGVAPTATRGRCAGRLHVGASRDHRSRRPGAPPAVGAARRAVGPLGGVWVHQDLARGVQRSYAAAWRPGTWHNLDSRVSWYLYHVGAGPWHLHWPPLPHHHGCPCHPGVAS